MKRVSILVFKNTTALAMVGAMEVFNLANKVHQSVRQDSSETSFFQVELISLWGTEVITANQYPLHCHRKIEDLQETDLILLPSLDTDVAENLALNEGYIPWLQKFAAQGIEIGSMCTGSFLLGAGGLLDGRKATTHWYFEGMFRQMFPEVDLLPGQLIVDDNGIYTCGGANAYLNLILYFVEKFCGRETALFASRMLLIDYDKISQKQYSIFSVQKHHQDEKILEAQSYMESHYKEGISIDDVIERVHLSKRNFIRRFKKATGNTPLEYLQRIKIEDVKKALESSNEPIGEIIFRSGYQDAGSFRQLFKKHTGLSPMEYRKKYHQPLIV